MTSADDESKPPKQVAGTVVPFAVFIMVTEMLYEMRTHDPVLALKLASRFRTASEGWTERAPESAHLVQLMAEYLDKAQKS